MDPMHDSELDTAEQKMPPALKPLVPFRGIPCLYCPETETVDINLSTLTFRCVECDKEWTVTDVRTTIAIWLRVLQWVHAIPDQE